MKKEEKKIKLCPGCHDNYYNGSNSTTGECWLLSTSKIVERTQVGTWQEPPYVWNPRKTLHCHRSEGHSWIKKDDVRISAPKKG